MVRHRRVVARSLILAAVSLALFSAPSPAATASKAGSVSNLIIKRKYQSAASALAALANKNDRNAQYKLGVMYRLGLGVPRSEEKALLWLGKAAAAGHGKAAALIKQLAFKPEPTVKKSGGAGATTPAVTGVNYAKLPPRQKGQVDWLTFAAARNNGEAIAALLQSNKKDLQADSALRAAVAANGFKAIDVLATASAPAAPSEANDKLVLREAVDRGQSSALAMLLQKMPALAKLLERDSEALHSAVAKCNSDINGTLAQAGTLDQAGNELFVAATRYCAIPHSDKLWSGLTNVDTADSNGRTALWYAAARGDDVTTKSLLDMGASEIADSSGLSPLHVAAANRHATTVGLLLQKAGQLPPPAADGTTALMFAATSGCEDCVSLIIEKTQDIDEKNASGNTALMLAALNKRDVVAKFLVSRGANISARNMGSDTPEKIAERLGTKLSAE